MRFFLPAVLLTMLLTSASYAAPTTLSKYVRCNPDQSECTVQTLRLTIGDRVGFFNDNNELAARGIVRSIKGSDRVVKILEKYGRIERDARVEAISKNAKFRSVKSELKLRAGGALGYSSYNVSGSMSGFEIGGFAGWSQPFGMELPAGLSAVARAVFLMGSQEIERTIVTAGGAQVTKETFDMMGFGVLTGVAYEGFRSSAVSVRGEFSFGGAFTSASLGSQDLADEAIKDAWDVNVNDGFNILVAGRLELLYNGFDKWHPSFGAAFMLHGESSGPTILLGLVRDIE